MFQTTKTKRPDRKDHLWHRREPRKGRPQGDWICILCGAIEAFPPDYPTPKDYVACYYQPLTDEERSLVPFKRN